MFNHKILDQQEKQIENEQAFALTKTEHQYHWIIKALETRYDCPCIFFFLIPFRLR
jgi:hypothetical protein